MSKALWRGAGRVAVLDGWRLFGVALAAGVGLGLVVGSMLGALVWAVGHV